MTSTAPYLAAFGHAFAEATRKRPWLANRKPQIANAGEREPAPTAAQQIAAAFERRRQPIPLGMFGRINVLDRIGRGICLDIDNPNVAFSADDCREAAHLLNQIAETLEAQS